MSKKRWFRFHIERWLKATRGFSANEIAVYLTIVCELYDHEGFAPLEPEIMARSSGMRPTSFQKALDSLVKRGKVTVEAGFLTSKAVAEEIISREKLVDKWKESRQKLSKNDNKINGVFQNASLIPEERIKNKEREEERYGDVLALPPSLPTLALGAASDREERSKRALEEFEKRRAQRSTKKPTFIKREVTH